MFGKSNFWNHPETCESIYIATKKRRRWPFGSLWEHGSLQFKHGQRSKTGPFGSNGFVSADPTTTETLEAILTTWGLSSTRHLAYCGSQCGARRKPRACEWSSFHRHRIIERDHRVIETHEAIIHAKHHLVPAAWGRVRAMGTPWGESENTWFAGHH